MTGAPGGAAHFDPASFVLANARVDTPSLVPEIRLHLAASLTDVWETTTDLAGHDVPPPYWAACWPGGQALARLVLDRPETVRHQRVLDVGTGGGVVAIAARMAGASQVIATDVDPFAAAAAAMNATLNGVSLEIQTRDVIGGDEGWDVVFAGDVCYERPLAQRISDWLRTLARRGALVLLGDPGRTYAPRYAIEPVARYRVPVSQELEDRDVRETTVWRLLP